MGLYKYLAKFEELMLEEINCQNLYISGQWTIDTFPKKWQGILMSMGCDKETPILAFNKTFDGKKYYDIVCFCPPKGTNSFTEYFYQKGSLWSRKISRRDYKTDAEFCKELDIAYQELQNLFTFLKLFEKQMDEMDKLIDIQSDDNKEIST